MDHSSGADQVFVTLIVGNERQPVYSSGEYWRG
jgi:hypothetical protein